MKKILFLFIIAISVSQVNAQQIPVLNQYIFNPYVYNPANAGTSGYNNIYLTHRNQWVDMPDAPVSNILTYDMSIKDSNVGIGGMLYTDETHIINNYGGLATYAYHVPFNEDKSHRLSIGVSGGILTQRFNFTQAVVENQADPTILENTDN